MRTPLFSVLHATYGRPEKAYSAMKMWLARAGAAPIEYIFAVNSDDPTADRLAALIIDQPVKVVTGDFIGSAAAWDAAAKQSTGRTLVQGQDDVEPPQDWAKDLLDLLMAHGGLITPMFVAVSDGFRKDDFCHMAIMNRAYYELAGEFTHSGYISVWSDAEVYYRAHVFDRKKLAHLIKAKEIVFLHRHHYHDKSVPMDTTYARENSCEAYEKGVHLFRRRNPEASGMVLTTWE